MNTKIRILFATALLGLTAIGGTARAELLLSGRTTGSFVDPGLEDTTVTNDPEGDSASFVTGEPFATPFATSLTFEGASFANIASGDPISIGILTIQNGSTLLGTTATEAVFNLGLDLDIPSLGLISLTQFVISIDTTPNSGSAIPDVFGVSFAPPAPVVIPGYVLNFSIEFEPLDLVVSEGATLTKGDIFVTFSPEITPIPEPSTYALAGAALLAVVVGVRRMKKNVAPAAA